MVKRAKLRLNTYLIQQALMKTMLAILAVGLCFCATAATTQNYTIQKLPPLEGDLDAGAYSLNDVGQAAGYSGNRAVIWTAGVPRNIQTIGASYSVAFGINLSGQAAGDISSAGTNSGAFFWSGSSMNRIIPPYGFVYEAYAINDAGAVVGTSSGTGGFKWQNGSFEELSFLPGDYSSRPVVINNLGMIGGSSAGSTAGVRPVVWLTPSTPQLISVPGGQGRVWGINNSGVAVGDAGVFSTLPFAWNASQGVRMLPLPNGASRGSAWAVNDAGVIIGHAGQAVIWRSNTAGEYAVETVADRLVDGTGWSNLSLYGINSSGQIAGEGLLNGVWHGFILTPQGSAPLVVKVRFVDKDAPDADWSSAEEWAEGRNLFAGRQAGDLVELSVTGIPAEMQATWSALKTGSEKVNGPTASTWLMNRGDFNWAPGLYTVRCEITNNGSVIKTLEVPISVGWRTDEYLLVGQVRPIRDYVLEEDRDDAVESALVGSYKLGDTYLANDARRLLKLLPVKENVFAWTAFQFLKYVWDESTGAPQFVRLPGVSTKERLWMVQTLLNEYPDTMELPEVLTASQLETLRTERSYRMFGRTQFRYLVDANGAIESSSVKATRQDFDNGPTKFLHIGNFIQGQISIRGVEVDLTGNSSQSLIASEAIPRNGSTNYAADGRSLSFFFGGRVGLEGRVPNYALFSRDAPFIFSEMIFAVGPNGKDTDSRIRFSVDKSWSPNGSHGTSHFNEVRIFARDYGDVGATFRLVHAPFEIAGQLAAFIQSGDRGWPGVAPAPVLR